MEFLLGAIFTIVLFSIIRAIFLRMDVPNRYGVVPLIYTQSYIHSLVGQKIADIIYPKEFPMTQAREFLSKDEIRVVLSDTHAYWILDNHLYQAEIIGGKIDDSTKKVVDTMAMSKVELDKMFFIVQKLTEGKNNDSGNSGVGRL